MSKCHKEKKFCIQCGNEIINRNAEKFCSHSCRGLYLRHQADLKRFKYISDFDEKLKKWRNVIKIAVQRCYKYIKTQDDLDDFSQICRISLWKLLSTHPENENTSYLLKTFDLAIKEYCREQGKNSQNFISEDPVFFANPEGIAENREIIQKIVNKDKFRLLLAYTLNDLTEMEMSKRLGMSKYDLSFQISQQRKVLMQCLQD